MDKEDTAFWMVAASLVATGLKFVLELPTLTRELRKALRHEEVKRLLTRERIIHLPPESRN